MEATQTQPTYPRGITFEQVWAALMEDREEIKKLRKIQEETAQVVKEAGQQIKETGLQMKETGRRLGHFDNLFGEISEYMIAPGLRKKFKEMGIIFQESARNIELDDDDHDIHFEIDVFLKNGEKAMLVEVKTKLTIDRVNKHIERLEKMRKYADLHGDKRTFLGAVASVVVTKEDRDYALNQGLYVIEPSGENFNITPPHGKPKEW